VAFFILRQADEQGACAPCGWDSKGCAYSRNRGLQHVGESHCLRQIKVPRCLGTSKKPLFS
jgi:hypothetical protein